MTKINPFTDGRKIPEVSINVKVKVNDMTEDENVQWNTVFGHLMRKPRTKVEFLNVTDIRKFDLQKINLDNLLPYLHNEDYEELKSIESIFNNKLTQDVKAFVLAILKIKPSTIEYISNNL